jgi:hypothetical protein
MHAIAQVEEEPDEDFVPSQPSNRRSASTSNRSNKRVSASSADEVRVHTLNSVFVSRTHCAALASRLYADTGS